MPGGPGGETGPWHSKSRSSKKSLKHSTIEKEDTSLSVMHCFTVTPCGCARLIVWVCLPHVKASQEQSNKKMKLLYFYTDIISFLSFLPLKDIKNLQGNRVQGMWAKWQKKHISQLTGEASTNRKVGEPGIIIKHHTSICSPLERKKRHSWEETKKRRSMGEHGLEG